MYICGIYVYIYLLKYSIYKGTRSKKSIHLFAASIHVHLLFFIHSHLSILYIYSGSTAKTTWKNIIHILPHSSSEKKKRLKQSCEKTITPHFSSIKKSTANLPENAAAVTTCSSCWVARGAFFWCARNTFCLANACVYFREGLILYRIAYVQFWTRI